MTHHGYCAKSPRGKLIMQFFRFTDYDSWWELCNKYYNPDTEKNKYKETKDRLKLDGWTVVRVKLVEVKTTK